MSEFRKIFENQMKLQEIALNTKLPIDNPEQFYLHATASSIELAEAIQEDNRWKKLMGGKRKLRLNKEAKLEELVDAQLFLINAIMFSGFNYDEFVSKCYAKHEVNLERMLKDDNNS